VAIQAASVTVRFTKVGADEHVDHIQLEMEWHRSLLNPIHPSPSLWFGRPNVLHETEVPYRQPVPNKEPEC